MSKELDLKTGKVTAYNPYKPDLFHIREALNEAQKTFNQRPNLIVLTTALWTAIVNARFTKTFGYQHVKAKFTKDERNELMGIPVLLSDRFLGVEFVATMEAQNGNLVMFEEESGFGFYGFGQGNLRP
jgi:hypothetical protein